ncbi:hypothetical protein [Ferrimicrobium sp.]|uniref:hypothetical protein n=1 Tax=Ferrimicrobium sp. TaxID=2926050 RepID=UPI002604E917|nr:hypothetical protein [Ferrimicrobium sp.]
MPIHRQPWWIILAILALFLAACGSTTSQHAATKSNRQGSTPSRSTTNPAVIPTSATQAGCTTGTLSATMSGQLAKSCYRIPNLAAGTYYLGIETILSPRGAAAAKEGISVPPGHSGPAVSLAVSPSSVVPGAKVTITGHLATPLSPQPAHTNVCFDGCVDGLHYNGTSVHWISSTTFQTSFVTPSGPWLERYPDRLLLPKAGSYRVAIQCLGVHKGCGLAHGEGSTTLTFTRSMTVATPQLTLSANKVLPGEMTPVKGTIALSNIIGKDQPIVDQFDILDNLPTKIIAKGVYQLPQAGSGAGTSVLLGPVTFRVVTPLTYQSISLKGATNIQLSADPSIFQESGTNGVALTCSAGPRDLARGMRMYSHGHTSLINTAGITTLLEARGVPSFLAHGATCSELAALHSPAGKTVIAASYAIEIPNQAPNFAYLPVITTNDGATWTVIPSPPGHAHATFAGLRSSRYLIHAYFTLLHHPEITEITENGVSWTQGILLCPGFGPCVRFTPMPGASNCTMNSASQPILVTRDQGRSFRQPAWPGTVNACAINELFSGPAPPSFRDPGTEYLLDPQSEYPLRQSTDGGAT